MKIQIRQRFCVVNDGSVPVLYYGTPRRGENVHACREEAGEGRGHEVGGKVVTTFVRALGEW